MADIPGEARDGQGCNKRAEKCAWSCRTLGTSPMCCCKENLDYLLLGWELDVGMARGEGMEVFVFKPGQRRTRRIGRGRVTEERRVVGTQGSNSLETRFYSFVHSLSSHSKIDSFQGFACF